MKLLIKINLVLVVVFGVGFALIANSAYRFLTNQARAQVLEEAQLMGAGASATKDYTVAEVSPVLEKTQMHVSTFLPQTIPFYAATETFKKQGAGYSDYTLREAALNPTNLADRPADWESDIIAYFRSHPHETNRVGERESAMGEALYVASPIVAERACLVCHGDPGVAPAGLIKHYGRNNGFGWKPEEIVGAQIISVPTAVPIKLANQGFRELLVSLGGILLAAIVLIDVALFVIVIRPLRKVQESADRISKGEVTLPPLEVKGRDEIAQVTESFNRMHTSLIKAFEMLNG